MTLTTPLPQILVNLLRASQILTFESPAGIKGNLIRTFTTVPVTRMCREPHERAWLPVVMVTRCIAGYGEEAPLSLSPHVNFHLFLTMEINPKVSHVNVM